MSFNLKKVLKLQTKELPVFKLVCQNYKKKDLNTLHFTVVIVELSQIRHLMFLTQFILNIHF